MGLWAVFPGRGQESRLLTLPLSQVKKPAGSLPCRGNHLNFLHKNYLTYFFLKLKNREFAIGGLTTNSFFSK
jgi:hypothetical protein